MENAFQRLQELRDSTDLSKIKLAIDRFKRASVEEPTSRKICIDQILKSIFQNNLTAELFDRIEDLFEFIRDPRIFLDELDRYTENKSLVVSTLMFIHELKCHFNIEYDEFYPKLASTVQKENCISEGYLLFLLKALKDSRIDEDYIKPILPRLSEASVEVSSKSCVKVLYTIIVILRMHPELFRTAKDLNQLYILLNSFEPIARIAKRIFVEAENPQLRPAMVFLENFVFPSLEN
ncbi:uncharacterized protein VICG_00816 [Vittaforma corneae ATCC 50505]|uniref:Uncharacterized protein n=1 Tax=Vittaforma corneae (strain ATCC 50505) TaxID=993615 RepID=L2GMQ4_VITCO|nr:uncharacterized protein VICG_00816 [Vittaforma corneae ATCC 50505]ELA42173.1 hypothetical protein VICG_00816 [Vittaforma corneae ATCC 50505]